MIFKLATKSFGKVIYNSYSMICRKTYSISAMVSCTRLRILLNTICRKPGFNSLRTPLNHGAEQASNETLKQTQQRNWSNASQGGQTALKEYLAVLHYETASTTQQPRDEHRGTIKDCKIAGATTWQGQGNHTFTTHGKNFWIFQKITAKGNCIQVWMSYSKLCLDVRMIRIN